jgi:hypothetical protein
MPRQASSLLQRISKAHDLKRPSVSGLLGHILSAALGGSAIALLLGGSALVGFLHYHGIAATHYLALLPVMVAALALVRGCRAWQADLVRYQKALADARHTHDLQY